MIAICESSKSGLKFINVLVAVPKLNEKSSLFQLILSNKISTLPSGESIMSSLPVMKGSKPIKEISNVAKIIIINNGFIFLKIKYKKYKNKLKIPEPLAVKKTEIEIMKKNMKRLLVFFSKLCIKNNVVIAKADMLDGDR